MGSPLVQTGCQCGTRGSLQKFDSAAAWPARQAAARHKYADLARGTIRLTGIAFVAAACTLDARSVQAEVTMLDRRRFAQLLGATALSACGQVIPDMSWPVLVGNAFAQDARPPVARGAYLIKNGAVVTVDPSLGTLPRADVLVRDGRIEAIGADLS